MIFWGLVLMLGGLLSALVAFLSNVGGMIGSIQEFGFAEWISRFFTPMYLTSGKIAFFIGVVIIVVGVVLFVRGKIAAKKNGQNDATTQKAGKFLRDLKGEFKKVTWPTLPDVTRNTIVTLAMIAVVGVIVCLVDLGLSGLIDLLMSIGE